MRHGRSDVGSGVPQVDWKDPSLSRYGQKAGTERQNASAIAGSAFWEDDDDSIGVPVDIGVETDQLCSGWWFRFRIGESPKDCLEKVDRFDEPRIRVCCCKDGIEYSSKI